MVKAVEMFEDSTGRVHKSDDEAWRAELIYTVLSSGAINEAGAAQVADHLIKECRTVATVAKHFLPQYTTEEII